MLRSFALARHEVEGKGPRGITFLDGATPVRLLANQRKGRLSRGVVFGPNVLTVVLTYCL